MDTKTAWQTLRDYAEGRIGHTYAGSCPDHVEGHDSRDPECLVCQALEAVAGAAPAAVAHLPAVLEQIAQGWDGCKYDAPGETLDIGADIRAAAKRLLAEHPAAVAGPAWDKTRRDLAIVMMGFVGNPSRSLEVAEIVLDAATEPGAPMAYLRAPAAPALEAPAAPVQFEAWWEKAGDGRSKMMAKRAWDAALAAAPQAPAAPWKDHLTARLVNDLRDCAIKYHGAGQLRDRIAHIVAPLCDQLKAAQAAPAAPAVDAPAPASERMTWEGLPFSDALTAAPHAPAAPAMDALDAARLDWLEEQAKQSPTGISFDYVRHAEDGQVLEKGWRFMRRHFLGERKSNLRAAIDAAQAAAKGAGDE